jgi:hypothetical protein
MGKMADLDLDIREAIQRGENPSEIARRLNIPTAWVQDIAEEYIGDENLEIELTDADSEDDLVYEHDGQPDEYTEWQDYMGGDDWDHGQYDEGSY